MISLMVAVEQHKIITNNTKSLCPKLTSMEHRRHRECEENNAAGNRRVRPRVDEEEAPDFSEWTAESIAQYIRDKIATIFLEKQPKVVLPTTLVDSGDATKKPPATEKHPIRTRPASSLVGSNASSTPENNIPIVALPTLPQSCLQGVARFLEPHETQDMASCCSKLWNTSQSQEFQTMRLQQLLTYFSILECHADMIFPPKEAVGAKMKMSRANEKKRKQQKNRRIWSNCLSWLSRILRECYTYQDYAEVCPVHRALVAEQAISGSLLCFQGHTELFRRSNNDSDDDDDDGDAVINWMSCLPDRLPKRSPRFKDIMPDLSQCYGEPPMVLMGTFSRTFAADSHMQDHLDRFRDDTRDQLITYPNPWFLSTFDNCGGWSLYATIQTTTTRRRSFAQKNDDNHLQQYKLEWFGSGGELESSFVSDETYPSMTALLCHGKGFINPSYCPDELLDWLLNRIAWCMAHKLAPFDDETVKIELLALLEPVMQLTVPPGSLVSGEEAPPTAVSEWTLNFYEAACLDDIKLAKANNYI